MCTKNFLQITREMKLVDPHLTDMENSPGALSLSLTRKAPHSRGLSRLSATLRDIRPANHLEAEEDERMRSRFAHIVWFKIKSIPINSTCTWCLSVSG